MDDCLILLILTMAAAGVAGTVEVHFENKDGGFFLKHTARQHYPVVADLGALPGTTGREGVPGGGSLLSVDRFTVFQTSQPMSVRATYGPFSTKQTVPARYIVPDPSPLNNTSLLSEVDHHLDMSAHMVRTELPRDSPVLRVLFHAGADSNGRGRQQVCIVLHVTMGDRPTLSSSCSPDGEDGVCLAEVTIPSSWWPPLPLPDEKPVKTPPRFARVSYSVVEPRGSECVPRVQIQPVTRLGTVPLVQARAGYRELRSDDNLSILVAHTPLYPRSRLHFPVFFYSQQQSNPIIGFVLRARVKSGLKLLGAECSMPEAWNVSIDVNPKHTVATVTAFRKQSTENASPPRVQEVLTWLVEVLDDGGDLWDEGRLVWSVRYVTEGSDHSRQHHALRPQRDDDTRRKITARLEVHKDDIQAVLPISKNWEVMNTAVLTGRQVSQAMKVFIVSQAGKVADVTLQSSCHSEDESILKVSSSCSSVYVDGSEIRGSWNASVSVKYGTYTGLAQFKVWMPEFPLEVNVADFKLSQVKGWRVPDEQLRNIVKIKKRDVDDVSNSENNNNDSSNNDNNGKPVQWDDINGLNGMVTEDVGNSIDEDKPGASCRLRYQQSPVEVFARFLAADHDSGRVSYFVSRRTWLRVTDLVSSLLRISDPRIASLHGQIVQGRSIGRTEVQVLSAISGRVIGAKELRIGSDKVLLTRLKVDVVSGLQLNIVPDSAIDNGYIAETSVTRKLTAQYQEGLLDIYLEFSDGTRTPLRDVSVTDYQLVVDSLNPEIVAFAPMVASPHPRVIAVGQGKGELLRVALLTPETCRGPTKRTPLLANTAQVHVDFANSGIQHRPDFVQNDGGASIGRGDRKHNREMSDLNDILIGIPLKDENNHEPTVQARQHHSNVGSNSLSMVTSTGSRHHGNYKMTPLEIGMYVLLAAFCFAIVVFVVSCVVYASKFKPQVPDSPPESSLPLMGGPSSSGMTNGLAVGRRPLPEQQQEPTTNAHDWIWLGRATLERVNNNNNNNNSNNNNVPQHRISAPIGHSSNASEHHMRITPNPNYTNQLPPQLPHPPVIDSSTYCKERPSRIQPENLWNILPPPPPLPPHSPHHNAQREDTDYRPPVPPHRNIGVTAKMSRQPDNTRNKLQLPEHSSARRHHHHHHHHHRNNSNGGGGGNRERERDGIHKNKHNYEGRSHCNEPHLPEPSQMLMEEGEDLPDNEFVEFSESPSEVKRATIVGNPMFSQEEERAREELLALEDLNLGMDYQQIMEYFDNLKESNA